MPSWSTQVLHVELCPEPHRLPTRNSPVVLVQETHWKEDTCYTTGPWQVVSTGAQTGDTSSDVAIFVHRRLVSADSLSYRVHAQGCVLHVRIPTKQASCQSGGTGPSVPACQVLRKARVRCDAISSEQRRHTLRVHGFLKQVRTLSLAQKQSVHARYQGFMVGFVSWIWSRRSTPCLDPPLPIVSVGLTLLKMLFNWLCSFTLSPVTTPPCQSTPGPLARLAEQNRGASSLPICSSH